MKQWFSEHKKAIFLSTGITLLPMLIGCILWNRLPDSFTIHWNSAGVADGFGGKALVVFVLPAILAVLNLLCTLGTAIDPRQAKQNKKALRVIFWIMPLLSLTVCTTIYAAAMGKALDVAMLIPLLLGVAFLVIGNYMPKLTQNATFGIKLYWTLHNEENWNKTHRFAGKLWVIGGIIMLASALLPVEWFLGVIIVNVVIMVIFPTLYSYRIYKAHLAQDIVYAKTPQQQKRFTLLTAVLVPVILAGVAVLMFTGDITYTCTEDTLQISATYASGLHLPYEAIESIELQEDFAVGMRTIGFSSGKLNLGSFQNSALQDYTLYGYTACRSMILIRADNQWLAINAATPEETAALYETLVAKTKL